MSNPVTEPLLPRPQQSLRRATVWSGFGNFIYLGCQYGTLAAIAKFGDVESVGEFALALAVAAPIILLSQMQLRQLQVTDVRDEVGFGDYLWHRMLFSGVAFLIIVAIALAYSARTGLVIAWIGAAKTIESVSDVAYGRMQRYGRLDLVAISMASKGILSFVAFAAAMAVSRNLVWAVATLAGVWALILFAFDLPMQRRVAPLGASRTRPQFAIIRALTQTAMPLAWTSAVVSVSGNLPRYFLDAMHGKEAVAIFAVAVTPLILANLLVGSVSQAVLPRAATYFQSGNLASFHRVGIRLVAIHVAFGVAAAAVFAFAGPSLITLFFTPEYISAVPLMVIMSLGTAAAGVGAYGALVLSSGRRFSLQLYNVVAMVLAQLVSAYLLIRSHGALGAGWSEFIRYTVSGIFLLIAGWLVVQSHQRTTYVRTT